MSVKRREGWGLTTLLHKILPHTPTKAEKPATVTDSWLFLELFTVISSGYQT